MAQSPLLGKFWTNFGSILEWILKYLGVDLKVSLKHVSAYVPFVFLHVCSKFDPSENQKETNKHTNKLLVRSREVKRSEEKRRGEN